MEVGTRVVRGPDWVSENQDGGEGSLGTVIRMGDDEDCTRQIAWVYWDCGTCANYRAGLDDKHDLLVFDSKNADTRHTFVTCDGCGKNPLLGLRWHCLDCPNFDLCTTCYMEDLHDINHHFERIDRSRSKGVPVGKRQEATKVPFEGIFPGAKVKRGKDWKYKDQDGGPGKEGQVVEVCGWRSGEKKDAARVHWSYGQRENIYRMGYEGKFDLQCTVPARGGSYYKSHHPAFHIEIKRKRNGLSTGDRVYVSVTVDKLKELAVEHVGWTPGIEDCMQRLGIVKDFTANGGVLVDFSGKCFECNQQALSKVPSYNRGDEVFVKDDEALVKNLQIGHGEWNHTMISILGRSGRVIEVHESGDLTVEVEDDNWILNPLAVIKVQCEERSEDSDSETSGISGLNGLFARLLSDMLLRDTGLNPRGNQGRTSSNNPGERLVQAGSQGHLSVVKDVLEIHPEKMNYVSSTAGKTALQAACHGGHTSIVQLLLNRGADTDILDHQSYTALHHAAYGNDRDGEVLQILLQHGVNPNPRNPKNNNTPLHLATKQGNDAAVRLLVQFPGCDINIQDNDGDTPLFFAIEEKRRSIIDSIINSPQLDMMLVNKRMFNYLHFAALKGNTYAVEKLLAKCPELINIPKEDGFTALHLAAMNDHCEIATVLCGQPPCNVNCRNSDGQSPLILAIQQGYSSMAEILVKHGADVNAEDQDGDTGLHLALMIEKFHSTEGLHLFLQDSEMNLGSGNSRTFANISRLLVNYGANVHHLNGKGESPLDKCEGSMVEDLIIQMATGSRPTATSMENDFCRPPDNRKGEADGVKEVHPRAQEGTSYLTEDKHSHLSKSNQSTSSLSSNGTEGRKNIELGSNSSGQNQTGEEELPSIDRPVTTITENTTSSYVEYLEAHKPDQTVPRPLDDESEFRHSDTSLPKSPKIEMKQETAIVKETDPFKHSTSIQKREDENKVSFVHEEAKKAALKEQGGAEIANSDNKEPGAEDADDCVVCSSNAAEVFFKPCGHNLVCNECCIRMKRCLKCGVTIKGKAMRDGNPIVDSNYKSITEKYRSLEMKVRKMEERAFCCICQEKKKNTVFQCGHGTCSACAEKLKCCHICKAEIKSKILMFD